MATKSEAGRLGGLRKGVNARTPKATHQGTLKIGGAEIPCFVLTDGTRVMTQRGLGSAVSLSSERGDSIPRFLGSKSMEPFSSKALTVGLESPIEFTMPQGGTAKGYRGDLLPELVEAVLAAADAGALGKPQAHVVAQCQALVRALARVGITALIDEATGYQRARTADALATLMEEYLAKDVRPWARAFPPDYYKALCDAYGLPFSVVSGEYPGYFGHATNNLIYDRMLPGMRAELKGLKAARRTGTMHQGLSEKVGTKALSHMIGLATAALRLGKSRPAAEKLMDELGYPVQPRESDND